MKCPNCKTKDVEKRVVNKDPVIRTACSGMNVRIPKMAIHVEYFCKDCNIKWKK